MCSLTPNAHHKLMYHRYYQSLEQVNVNDNIYKTAGKFLSKMDFEDFFEFSSDKKLINKVCKIFTSVQSMGKYIRVCIFKV